MDGVLAVILVKLGQCLNSCLVQSKIKNIDGLKMLLDTYVGCDLVLNVALEAVHL